jgi:hypothetical protein
VTPAELPPSVETLRKGKEHSKRRLESNAGITAQWHLKLYRRNAHMQAGCSSRALAAKRRRRSSYTVHTRLRRNERLAIERSQQTDVRDCQEPLRKSSEEEAVTPCTRDYVATNGWLSKGRNRLTSGRKSSEEEEEVLHREEEFEEEVLHGAHATTSQRTAG